MEWIAQTFKTFVEGVYQREITEEWKRPKMEVILSGYSAEHREPELWRLVFNYNRTTSKFECDVSNPVARGQFNVIFGGQYDVIQRVVNGIDWPSYWSLKQRAVKMLGEYHDEMQAKVHAIDPKITIPKPDFWDENYNIFKDEQGAV
jgi:hypothetical protein